MATVLAPLARGARRVDLLAVAAQELLPVAGAVAGAAVETLAASPAEGSGASAHIYEPWERRVAAALGPAYILVAAAGIGPTHVMLLVRADNVALEGAVSCVATSTVARGPLVANHAGAWGLRRRRLATAARPSRCGSTARACSSSARTSRRTRSTRARATPTSALDAELFEERDGDAEHGPLRVPREQLDRFARRGRRPSGGRRRGRIRRR